MDNINMKNKNYYLHISHSRAIHNNKKIYINKLSTFTQYKYE